MSKTMLQEPIPARLVVIEDEKVWCCGVQDCKEELATFRPAVPTVILKMGLGGVVKDRKREPGIACVAVEERFDQMDADAGLWGDKDGAEVPAALKKRYDENRKAENKAVKELKAHLKEQPDDENALQLLGAIEKAHFERSFTQAELDERSLYILCPLHGIRNEIKSIE